MSTRKPALFVFLLLTAVTSPGGPAFAADPEYRLVIRDHRFEPEMLVVPTGQRIRLLVENADATPEEFESHKLNREKIIPGKSTGVIFIGPLSPDTYPFFGEFHEKTARGRLVVR